MVKINYRKGDCMKTKRIIALLTAASMVLMGGCASDTVNETKTDTDNQAVGSENESENENTDSGGKTVLTFTYKQSASNDPLETWLKDKNIIEQFEADHPGCKIELSPISSSEGDYATLLALQLSSESTAPDIFMEDTYMTATDAASGYLACLDEYLESWEDWDQYLEGTKAAVKGTDGKIYGIPVSTDSRGIFYNKEILEKAGYSIPWQPENWDDIIEAAVKIKETQPDTAGLFLTVNTSSGEAVSMQTFEQLLYGTGDQLYSDGKWLVKSQGLLDTFSFISGVVNDGLMVDIDVALSNDTMIQRDIVDGKVGMVFNVCTFSNSWLSTGDYLVDNVEDVIGFAAMPTQHGGDPATVTMTGGWSWAVSSHCENKELAVEFLKFCGSKENAASRCLYDGRMSPRADSLEIEEYTKRPYINETTAYMENAFVRPKDENYAMVTTQIQTIVEEVASGALTAEQAVEEYASRVIGIVGEDNVEER